MKKNAEFVSLVNKINHIKNIANNEESFDEDFL